MEIDLDRAELMVCSAGTLVLVWPYGEGRPGRTDVYHLQSHTYCNHSGALTYFRGEPASAKQNMLEAKLRALLADDSLDVVYVSALWAILDKGWDPRVVPGRTIVEDVVG